MPRKPSGQPHWKAIAVKLPLEDIEKLYDFSDRYRVSISDLVRQGLAWRMQQPVRDTSGEATEERGPTPLSRDDILALVDDTVHRILLRKEHADTVIPSHAVISQQEMMPEQVVSPLSQWPTDA